MSGIESGSTNTSESSLAAAPVAVESPTSSLLLPATIESNSPIITLELTETIPPAPDDETIENALALVAEEEIEEDEPGDEMEETDPNLLAKVEDQVKPEVPPEKKQKNARGVYEQVSKALNKRARFGGSPYLEFDFNDRKDIDVDTFINEAQVRGKKVYRTPDGKIIVAQNDKAFEQFKAANPTVTELTAVEPTASKENQNTSFEAGVKAFKEKRFGAAAVNMVGGLAKNVMYSIPIIKHMREKVSALETYATYKQNRGALAFVKNGWDRLIGNIEWDEDYLPVELGENGKVNIKDALNLRDPKDPGAIDNRKSILNKLNIGYKNTPENGNMLQKLRGVVDLKIFTRLLNPLRTEDNVLASSLMSVTRVMALLNPSSHLYKIVDGAAAVGGMLGNSFKDFILTNNKGVREFIMDTITTPATALGALLIGDFAARNLNIINNAFLIKSLAQLFYSGTYSAFLEVYARMRFGNNMEARKRFIRDRMGSYAKVLAAMTAAELIYKASTPELPLPAAVTTETTTNTIQAQRFEFDRNQMLGWAGQNGTTPNLNNLGSFDISNTTNNLNNSTIPRMLFVENLQELQTVPDAQLQQLANLVGKTDIRQLTQQDYVDIATVLAQYEARTGIRINISSDMIDLNNLKQFGPDQGRGFFEGGDSVYRTPVGMVETNVQPVVTPEVPVTVNGRLDFNEFELTSWANQAGNVSGNLGAFDISNTTNNLNSGAIPRMLLVENLQELQTIPDGQLQQLTGLVGKTRIEDLTQQDYINIATVIAQAEARTGVRINLNTDTLNLDLLNQFGPAQGRGFFENGQSVYRPPNVLLGQNLVETIDLNQPESQGLNELLGLNPSPDESIVFAGHLENPNFVNDANREEFNILARNVGIGALGVVGVGYYWNSRRDVVRQKRLLSNLNRLDRTKLDEKEKAEVDALMKEFAKYPNPKLFPKETFKTAQDKYKELYRKTTPFGFIRQYFPNWKAIPLMGTVSQIANKRLGKESGTKQLQTLQETGKVMEVAVPKIKQIVELNIQKINKDVDEKTETEEQKSARMRKIQDVENKFKKVQNDINQLQYLQAMVAPAGGKLTGELANQYNQFLEAAKVYAATDQIDAALQRAIESANPTATTTSSTPQQDPANPTNTTQTANPINTTNPSAPLKKPERPTFLPPKPDPKYATPEEILAYEINPEVIRYEDEVKAYEEQNKQWFEDASKSFNAAKTPEDKIAVIKTKFGLDENATLTELKKAIRNKQMELGTDQAAQAEFNDELVILNKMIDQITAQKELINQQDKPKAA